MADTYHGTVEDAMSQAEFEYDHITERWAKRPSP